MGGFRVCGESEHTTLVETDSLTEINESDGTTESEYTYSESGSGDLTTWSGTYSSSQQYPPDPAVPDSGPSTYPGLATVTLDEDFTYFGYAFTKVTIDTSDPSYADTIEDSITYSEPVTVADLDAEITARIALLAGDPWPGTACISSAEYAEGLADPSDPPVEGEVLPVVCTQVTGATKSRYRIGIPADYADRSYYEWQGDEVFFPDDPMVPPSLVASRSWTYAGTDEWSSWWEIAVPTTPGETRLVNQMARHYRSTRLGNKPTAFGEVYEF